LNNDGDPNASRRHEPFHQSNRLSHQELATAVPCRLHLVENVAGGFNHDVLHPEFFRQLGQSDFGNDCLNRLPGERGDNCAIVAVSAALSSSDFTASMSSRSVGL